MTGHTANKRVSLLIVLALVVSLVILATAQDRHTTQPVTKQVGEQEPFAVYDDSIKAESMKSADPAGSLRSIRNSHYDKGKPKGIWVNKPTDKIHALPAFTHWWVGLPAFPVAQSDGIVLGRITSANVYLSNDQTGVYTEFTIQLREALKGPTNLSPGDSITSEREGGTVQYPSGEMREHVLQHKSMPRVGKDYLLFLAYDGERQSFSIITGYELPDDRVLPLDNIEPFSAYKGYDQNLLIEEVKKDIAHSREKGGSL